ncbi:MULTISPECIES: sugar ABC transporter substrate-binding protein [Paraburkholderia]|uniref:sugar ABC transporter substrate-binding protein n=1 Tax=Paraburkholderia TaxID=1822464 RepID=UPI0022565372|nr:MULTISPECIES: sugar ABC transporter substrate-binding protein [Paraburkholderia]MCX4163645.1 sugar ABC transporter substrate-binding protein [Paraburkholderia megapolitana]MDN7159140.1 sugar ABC transporter substrate-binding protein [Paraburkholderia sp. CHISQ3]MDQ6496187.1 sugar ABC transporter substrate-binding protein [Paraburkholderia megapolitana]
MRIRIQCRSTSSIVRSLANVACATAFLAAVSLTHAAEAKKSVTISVVLPFNSMEWSTQMREGAEAAVAQFGEKVHLKVVGPATYDTAKQVQMFQSEIQAGSDGIVIVNVAQAFFVEPARQAQRQGIGIVWVDSPPAASVKTALFVGQDEHAMAKHAGELVARNILARSGKPASQISGAVVTGACARGVETLDARLNGFKQAIHAELPNVALPSTFDSKVDRSQNYAAWSQAIQAHPDAVAYMDPCEYGDENIAKILSDQKRSASIVALNDAAEIREDIKGRRILAALPGNYFNAGFMSVYLLASHLLAGQSLPSGWFETPTTQIDVSNVDALIAASKSKDGLYRYYKPTLDQLIKNPPALQSLEKWYQ